MHLYWAQQSCRLRSGSTSIDGDLDLLWAATTARTSDSVVREFLQNPVNRHEDRPTDASQQHQLTIASLLHGKQDCQSTVQYRCPSVCKKNQLLFHHHKLVSSNQLFSAVPPPHTRIIQPAILCMSKTITMNSTQSSAQHPTRLVTTVHECNKWTPNHEMSLIC